MEMNCPRKKKWSLFWFELQ